MITKASHGHQGLDRAEQWRAAAAAAVELYAEHPAMAWVDLAGEAAAEVRLLAAVRAELRRARPRPRRGRPVHRPGPAPATLPGLAEVGAPTVTAIIGRAGRFRTGRQFRSSPASPRGPARPAKPTARASPCPRPVTGCCAPP